ncbi:MAG: amino acid ABC transporter ATP-binding protein [Alphaproteobacteria bacterium]|nr:amino acid ABC transporter ATP-binding protein [Alphaproteobacteria bacterium]OJV45340.1 MAG: peptide ABC transporter ATP-binding protein [Alphaproteobacteria bacterium 43-37]
MIKMSHISKTFGTLNVLSDINLTIQEKEIVAIIGPSGSGKTTLLRCINLLEMPTTGSVTVGSVTFNADGNRSNETITAIRKQIGMVFQNFHLFPHLSVLDNLTYAPIHVLKTPPEAAKNKAIQLLDRVGLKDKASAFPAQLSGGQKQRVAIARALAMEPNIMLFDEPTSSLDPEMVKEVLDVMKELTHNHMTMVVVTHEMRFAEAAASRLLFMDQGRIIEDTSPKAFFTKPKTKRAQEFLSRLV